MVEKEDGLLIQVLHRDDCFDDMLLEICSNLCSATYPRHHHKFIQRCIGFYQTLFFKSGDMKYMTKEFFFTLVLFRWFQRILQSQEQGIKTHTQGFKRDLMHPKLLAVICSKSNQWKNWKAHRVWFSLLTYSNFPL